MEKRDKLRGHRTNPVLFFDFTEKFAALMWGSAECIFSRIEV